MGGGWTALLGPGLGLASTLATPAYFARIAWRFARRAARIASTGGGDWGRSNSISGCGGAGARGDCCWGAESAVPTGEGPRLGGWGDSLKKVYHE